MPEDASLDDFLSTPSSTDEEGGEPSPERDGEAATSDDGGDETTTETSAAGSIRPATSTSRSVPDGTACPDCGGSTTRLWRDGDRLVCSGCKAWDEG